MIQEIIAYSIIVGAVVYTLLGILKLFGVTGKKQNHACNGSCNACSSVSNAGGAFVPHKYFSAK